MSLSNVESGLAQRLERAIVDVTPGVLVRAFRRGQQVCDLRVGQTHDYYDLASLTKILFTQQALMGAFERGLFSLDTLVSDRLPEFAGRGICVRDLLTHMSGLEWWVPFYQSMDLTLRWQERRRWLLTQLVQAPCKRAARAVYSDLGFMLLGCLLESWHEKDLLQIWRELKADSYPDSTLEFHVGNRPLYSVQRYAPTEVCAWRGKRMCGEVHDENAWALGGLSTHAGLFGSMDDLAGFGLQLRARLLGMAPAGLRQQTVQLFAHRAVAPQQGDWALGFMMPTPGSASCGSYFSPESIGHTGFTGTSLWFDPRQDLLVAILSNRVYFGRDNRQFISLRPQIHDWIAQSL